MPSSLLALVVLVRLAVYTTLAAGFEGSNDIDSEILSQLHECILSDDMPKFTQLLEAHGPHYSNGSSTHELRLPLLQLAVIYNRLETVKTLVAAGTDVNGLLGFGNDLVVTLNRTAIVYGHPPGRKSM